MRDELLKFHSSYYSANIMALTILGRGTVSLYMRLGIITVNNCEILCMIFNFHFWNIQRPMLVSSRGQHRFMVPATYKNLEFGMFYFPIQ